MTKTRISLQHHCRRKIKNLPVQVLGNIVGSQIRSDEDSANEELQRVESDVVFRVEVIWHRSRDIDESTERRGSCVTLIAPKVVSL